MSVVVVCPGCGQKYSAGPELAGKKIRCRGCGGGVRVPEASSAAPASRPTPPRAAAPAAPKSSPPKPAAPKPAPPPLDDDLDAYGLAEEPEVARQPEEELFTPEGPPSRRVKAKATGKKRKKGRGGIGGWLGSVAESPLLAWGFGLLIAGLLLYMVVNPRAGVMLCFLLGCGGVILGVLVVAILSFAQAPGLAVALIALMIVTLSVASAMGGIERGRSGRAPAILVGSLIAKFLWRWKGGHIRRDGPAFRIPKMMMYGGVTLVGAALLTAIAFPQAGLLNRPGGRRQAAMQPGGPPRLPFGVKPVKIPMPDLPVGQLLEPGVMFHEVTRGPLWVPGSPAVLSGRLWVYLPEGDAPPKSLPCVVIAGAGSPMITGMNLSEGDQAEHLPWVKAGFAVVAYDVDGDPQVPLTEQTPMALLRPAIEGFLSARAGAANAVQTLYYIAAKLPQVDPSRIIAVGHSSAGTLALLATENDPRIRAVAAFAPGRYEDPPDRAASIRGMERAVPAISEFLTTLNPATPKNLAKLNVPVFLFTAEDDENVPARLTRDLAGKLRSQGKRVTLETVPTGGHYDAMIGPGIAQAIAWARALPGGG